MSRKDSIEKSLIFMPDISGFTSFINEVEVEHSTHIITELLEIILESNSLGLKVSEIEGDAILFYNPGEAPSITDLINQAEEMFIAFHNHLKFYQTNRICQCGACSTAHNLSLKFVAHHGPLAVRLIKSHEKLFGPDVTLAHRLLKNNVNGKEYVLFTEHILNASANIGEHKMFENGQFKQGSVDYEGIGKVNYSYISLDSRGLKINDLNKHDHINLKYRNPVKVSKNITASLQKTHSVITNVMLKPKWFVGLRKVNPENNKLDIIGSKHQCITNLGSVEIEVSSQKIDEGFIEYGERTTNINWLAPVNIIYQMNRITENDTLVSISVHYKRNFLSRFYLDFPLRLMIALMTRLSLIKLSKMQELN
jgi:hypothetical protein